MSNPLVHLNHVIIYVDEPTRSAIAQSAFMKNEFAAFEAAAVAIEDGGGWSGLYIDGEQTYVEIFGPSQASENGHTAGDASVCLGVGHAGGLKEACVLLGDITAPDLVKRQISSQEIPWFHYVDLDDAVVPGSLFTASIIEYDQHFLRNSRPGLIAGEEGITRKQYNAVRYQPGRYLKDIIEVTLALAADEAARFGRQLAALGYVEASEGETKTFSSQQLILRVMPRTALLQGVVALKLSLLRKKEGETIYRFGEGSVLRFDDEHTASWLFGHALE
ncbi:hypothetical protein LT85_3077 [Collimonas arenae]|uniref:Uncharacterized protein n=1 Tax=Collimonas arenae TaxID=279058 RepID=A0A0A1FEN6_9BURK|nr:DUF5829 family protein [Collimonas arenae]AIY42235.1 hypothetical protein LT85_3077 [Collimonas arenae]